MNNFFNINLELELYLIAFIIIFTIAYWTKHNKVKNGNK